MPARLRSLVLAVLSLVLLSLFAVWRLPGQEAPQPEIIPALRHTGPTYWKGNLHTHSLWSDGDDFPEMIADWYKTHGYQFLMFSEHNVLAEGERWLDVPKTGTREQAVAKYRRRCGERWVETRTTDAGKDQVRLKPLAEFRPLLEEAGRFLLIPGEEITHRFAKLPVHMNAVNVRDVISPISGPNVSETVRVNLRAVADQRKRTKGRTIAFLNHPNFGWAVKAEDLLLEELRFFEVHNGHNDVRNEGNVSHPSTDQLWDIALALRLGKERLPTLFGLATDDAHAYHAFGPSKANPGRGWIMVRAPYLTPEALVNALEAGDFYATSGVLLDDVAAGAGQLALTIHGEPGVTYRTEFIGTLRDTPLASEGRTGIFGQPLDVTRVYHPGVGQVLATSDALQPSYRLTGRELYVRARVTSSRPHPNPYRKGNLETAWTQPLVP